MNRELDSLRGRELPGPPQDFQTRVEGDVLPTMKRRRIVRRVKRSFAACATVACLGFLYSVGPFDSIDKPTLGDLTRIAKDLRDSTGIAHLGIEKKSLEELLELRRELEERKGNSSAGSMVHIPIQNFVEWSDYLVQGVVEEVTVNRDRLIVDIKARRVRPLYLTVRLRVVESHPDLDKEYIDVSSTGDPERMGVGNGFLMALKNTSGTFSPMYGFGAQGVYLIQAGGAEATVSGLVRVPHTMSVSRAWELIRDLHDAMRGGEQPDDPEKLQSKIDALKNGTLEEAALSLRYLSVANKALLDADVLLDALENQYDRLLEGDEVPEGHFGPVRTRLLHEPYAYCDFARMALKILYPIATEDAVDRLLDLHFHDMSNVHNRVFDEFYLSQDMLRFALKHPGPDRRERVLGLLGREVSYYDARGNRIGGATLVMPDYRSLMLVAETPGDDMGEMLEEILHRDEYDLWRGGAGIRPEASAEILRARQKMLDAEEPVGALEMLEAFIAARNGRTTWFPPHIKHRIKPGDTDTVPIIQRFPMGRVADLIWLKTPDPAFVPALRDAIGAVEAPNGLLHGSPLLQALHACGEELEAMRLATQLLEREIDDSSLDELESDVIEQIEALRYLGRVGNTVDTDVVPLIRSFLVDRLLAKYDRAQQRAYRITLSAAEPNRREFLEYRSFQRRPLSAELKTTALLALTRLGAPGVLREWQEIYRETDVPRRMIAAIALYYLGDDTAEEYIQAFRSHAEKGIKELDAHLHSQGWTGEFQKAILYLRSPKLDTLFLERIENGLDNGDQEPLVYDLTFVMDHAGRVLRALSAHLESKDMMTRNVAHSCLEGILGSGTEWDSMALTGTQPEVVAQLRAEAEAFISADMSPNR